MIRPYSISLAIFALGCFAFAHHVRSLPPPRPAPIAPYHDRWVMDWHGCPYGSCAPAFRPVPDGGYRFLSCSSGWCGLHLYVYWTDESCNVLTACPQYKPHRGDHDPR
jgi:hypothetical protein